MGKSSENERRLALVARVRHMNSASARNSAVIELPMVDGLIP